jgi:hypothetical protein
MKKYLPWIIIGILSILLVIMQQCRKTPEPEIVTTITHDTIPGDSIPYEVLLKKPYPVYRDTGSTKWKYEKVDTCQILKNYYAENFYQDTLKDDTSALIVVNDIVTENQLQERKLTFQNRRATVINTTITNIGEIPRNKFFVGLAIGRSLNNFAVGPSILFVTKKSFAYGLTYDAINKDVYGSFYYKISFKKKR